jgi:hypothetical protein
MKTQGQKTAKPRGTVTIVLETETFDTVKQRAEDEDRSLNNYINRFFKKYLPRELEAVNAAKTSQVN